LTPPAAADKGFSVVLDGKKAVVKEQFEFVLRWSNPETWGTDVPPVKGDYVFVPTG